MRLGWRGASACTFAEVGTISGAINVRLCQCLSQLA
jgi:hypothetical protein